MRRIVLTGVTKGLGRAMAEWFSRAGCEVHGCGRSAEAIREISRKLSGQHFDVVDVADDAAVAKWAGRVLERSGAPDLLINNAAVIAPNAPLWKLTAEQVEPVVRVNILGVIHVIRHFLPAMIERGTGVVVNFSSGWGRSTSPEVATYCASKWAIEGLTQALSQELPDGLAAVALNPGIIDTDMLRVCFGEAAGGYPDADEWVREAGPFLLGLNAGHNGRALTVPSARTD